MFANFWLTSRPFHENFAKMDKGIFVSALYKQVRVLPTYVVMWVGLGEAATPCALTVHNVQYFGIARQKLVL